MIGAFFNNLSIWDFHERFSFRFNPKNIIFSTRSKGDLLKNKCLS